MGMVLVRRARGLAGLIAAAAAIGSSGCATRQVRGGQSPAPGALYPAVRMDCEIVGACFTGNTGFHSGGAVSKALGYTVVPLCWILDMPVSAVSDTVCLPWDWRREKDRKSVV